MMALIVVKCVLRGRPQGGRAVFIHWLDFARKDDSNGCLIIVSFVIVLEIWIWNVTLGLQIQIVRVDLVELIGKRSILCIQTTNNG
jgi:hypothetical protein